MGKEDNSAGSNYEGLVLPEQVLSPRQWEYGDIEDENLRDFMKRAHDHLVEQSVGEYPVAQNLYSFVDDLSPDIAYKKESLRVNWLSSCLRNPERYGFFRGVLPESERGDDKEGKISADFETMMARYAFLYLRQEAVSSGDRIPKELSIHIFDRAIDRLGEHPLGVYFQERKKIYESVRQRDLAVAKEVAPVKEQEGKGNWIKRHTGELAHEHRYTSSDLKKIANSIRSHHPDWWTETDWSAKFKELGIREGLLRRIRFMRGIDRGYLDLRDDLPTPAQAVEYLLHIAKELDHKKNSLGGQAVTFGHASSERMKVLMVKIKEKRSGKKISDEVVLDEDEDSVIVAAPLNAEPPLGDVDLD